MLDARQAKFLCKFLMSFFMSNWRRSQKNLSKLNILTKSREWPAAYYDHEVVKNSKEKQVLPCVLYVDGAKTTKRSGVIGFWTYELITMRRCLVAVLAKSEMCRCGCGGWCSIW